MLTLKSVKAAAAEKGKAVKFNRSTGLYQVTHGFTSSEGVLPARDNKGKIYLSQQDLATLKSYI